MVNVDLDVKGLVGLAENESINRIKLRDYLRNFEKDILIQFIVDDVFSEEDDVEEDL